MENQDTCLETPSLALCMRHSQTAAARNFLLLSYDLNSSDLNYEIWEFTQQLCVWDAGQQRRRTRAATCWYAVLQVVCSIDHCRHCRQWMEKVPTHVFLHKEDTWNICCRQNKTVNITTGKVLFWNAWNAKYILCYLTMLQYRIWL